MFGIGMSEILVILMLALIVFGPHKLPELAKTLGKAYGQLKKEIEGITDIVGEEENEIMTELGEASNAASDNRVEKDRMDGGPLAG